MAADKRKTFPEKGSFVKKGTTIIEAEPFVAVLSSKLHSQHCDNCFKKCKIFRCSGCQYVYYCSKDCQRKSWSLHKVECPNIKRVYPREVPGTVRMIARTIIKLRNGGDKERGYYSQSEYRTFGDLMSHYSDIKADLKEIEHFKSVYVVLVQFLANTALPSTREVLEIFGRIRINSFHVLDSELMSVGVGVYLGPSIIDHSCKANTSTIFNGTTLVLRTVRDIPSFDWSKVSVSYIDVLRSVEERRAELQSSYYFWCNCERCINPEPAASAAACPNANCTNPCSPKDIECAKCNEVLPSNYQDDFELVESRAYRKLEKIDQTKDMDDTEKLEICRMCLKEQEGVLHPFNILHVRTMEMALSIAGKFELWGEAEIYARKLAQQYEYYFGDTHPMTGGMYFTLVKALDVGEKLEEAYDVARKASKVLRIAFGENDTKTREMDDIVNWLQAKSKIIDDHRT